MLVGVLQHLNQYSNLNRPKFKQKVKLPKASKDPRPEGYLIARKLDPDKFYFAENFKAWVNSIKPNF